LATLQALVHAPGNERYINSLGYLIPFRGPDLAHALAGAVGLPTSPVSQMSDNIEGLVRGGLMLVAGAVGLATLLLRPRRRLPAHQPSPRCIG